MLYPDQPYRAKTCQIAIHKTSDSRVITDMANPGGREYFFIVPNLTRQFFDCAERMVIKISFVYLRRKCSGKTVSQFSD